MTFRYNDEGSESDEADLEEQRDTLGAERLHVPDATPSTVGHETITFCEEDLQFAAFNGRCNKNGDTCYAFWVGGTLDVSPLSLLL